MQLDPWFTYWFIQSAIALWASLYFAPDAGYYVDGVMQKKWGWLSMPAALLMIFNCAAAFGINVFP
jgi:hypothetical protein